MDERKRLLKEQWNLASPIIGQLLDAWDEVPNDAKGYVEECVPRFVALMDELAQAMGLPDK